jgi:hypothetical protein
MSKARNRALPIHDLFEVVMYLHDQEFHHYTECADGDEAEDHVYLHVVELLRWFATRQSAAYPQYAKAACVCLDEFNTVQGEKAAA